MALSIGSAISIFQERCHPGVDPGPTSKSFHQRCLSDSDSGFPGGKQQRIRTFAYTSLGRTTPHCCQVKVKHSFPPLRPSLRRRISSIYTIEPNQAFPLTIVYSMKHSEIDRHTQGRVKNRYGTALAYQAGANNARKWPISFALSSTKFTIFGPC